jgi:hypothetical protein
MTLTGQDGIDFLAQCEAADIGTAELRSIRPRMDHEAKGRNADWFQSEENTEHISHFIKE